MHGWRSAKGPNLLPKVEKKYLGIRTEENQNENKASRQVISDTVKRAKTDYGHHSNSDFLSNFQSTYRRNRSVETTLGKIYADLIINDAYGKCTLLVQLDLSGAFDTIDVTLLLKDLQSFGKDGDVHNRFLTIQKLGSFTCSLMNFTLRLDT